MPVIILLLYEYEGANNIATHDSKINIDMAVIVLKNVNGSGVEFPPTKSVSKCLHEPHTVEAPVAYDSSDTVLAP